MEKQKIIIRDKKKKHPVVVYSDHPYYEEIKSTIMPDEYRDTMHKISDLPDDIIEDYVKLYYELIEKSSYRDFTAIEDAPEIFSNPMCTLAITTYRRKPNKY